MPSIPKDDIKRRELSYKASKDVLKATGLFPSNQYAHNIYNENSKNVTVAIDPVIMRLCSEQEKKNVFGIEMVKKDGENEPDNKLGMNEENLNNVGDTI